MRLVLASMLVITTLALAGCINAPEEEPEPVNPTGGNPPPATSGNNTTIDFKPPVARMQIFDVDGALVFESNFVADNATAQAPLQSGGPVTFVGSSSEAVDPTATVNQWAWSFGDGDVATGRSVQHEYRDTGGVFRVVLRVQDSNNLSDTLVVTIGVQPSRTFNESLAFDGSLTLGTAGVLAQDGIDTATHTFDVVDNVEGSPVELESLTLTLTPGGATAPLADFDVFLLDAEGTEIASSASVPAPGGEERISLSHGALGPGTYTVRVVLFLGPLGEYSLSGEAVYGVVNAQVDEMFGGHSH